MKAALILFSTLKLPLCYLDDQVVAGEGSHHKCLRQEGPACHSLGRLHGAHRSGSYPGGSWGGAQLSGQTGTTLTPPPTPMKGASTGAI